MQGKGHNGCRAPWPRTSPRTNRGRRHSPDLHQPQGAGPPAAAAHARRGAVHTDVLAMEQRIISDVEAKLSTLYANMREPKEIKLLGAMQFFTKYLQRELEQRELDLSTLTKTQIDDLIEDCLLLAGKLQQIAIEDMRNLGLSKVTLYAKLTLVNIGNPDADFELMGTLTPEERAAQSMKRAEKNGEVIDLCNL